jgi:hypothetical protein
LQLVKVIVEFSADVSFLFSCEIVVRIERVPLVQVRAEWWLNSGGIVGRSGRDVNVS